MNTVDRSLRKLISMAQHAFTVAPRTELHQTIGCDELYIDLLVRSVSNTIYGDGCTMGDEVTQYDPNARRDGMDWPAQAHTMIGLKRLDNVRHLCCDSIRNNVPGDFIEAGVWRGGACILMRGILAAYGSVDRCVYVADSFEGLPKPSPDLYPADEGDNHYRHKQLAVSIDEVKENFSRYGLLDDQVSFLRGWFKDTLPTIRDRKFAVIRLDGDMYESTMDGLRNLYDLLSPGGFVIVDDYGAVPACRLAVDQFRADLDIKDEIHKIDWTGIWWQKK